MSWVRYAVTSVSVSVTACGSLSGLDAQTDFGCKAPKGVSCASITAVHANANAGTLPALQRGGQDGPVEPDGSSVRGVAPPRTERSGYVTPEPLPTAQAAAQAGAGVSPASMNAPSTGTPLRTPERILRVWVAPFEDSDGDFHDQRYLYVTVNHGQWTVQRARAGVRNQYQTVRPLSKDKEASEPAAAKSLQPAAVQPPAVGAPSVAQ